VSTKQLAPPWAPKLTARTSHLGDRLLQVLTLLGGIATAVVLVGVFYKVFDQASLAISRFGLAFIGRQEWNPVTGHFGAADFLFGTAVTSAFALLIAAPLSLAIALFLTELAPRPLQAPVGMLVELLAAIPSAVLGLWGIAVMGPVLARTIEPALRSVLGFMPLFSGPSSPAGLLPAALVLTIMTVPIVSTVTRELFASVPRELKEGALALGATRWEMVKLVILPYSRNGIVGAVLLGLGRALGEAIAVAMVVGHTPGIHASLFAPGDTLASRIASEYLGATTTLQISSLAYLAGILLVLAVLSNLVARTVAGAAAGVPGAVAR